MDVVAAAAAIDGHAVGLAVAGRAAHGGRQIDGHQPGVGARKIADIDLVGAALGGELDALDVVQVHDDIGDVAEEMHSPAVGENVDALGDIGAVEQHGVDAGTALDHVVVVARVPDEQVVAGAQDGDVGAVAAIDGVVAGAAEDDIVAKAAVDLQADLAGGKTAGVDDVVAAQAVDGQQVRLVGVIDNHRRRQALDCDLAARRGDGDHVVAIGGVDGDGIALAVAAAAVERRRQIDFDLGDVGALEIADDDVVRAAERLDVNALHLVQVHDDVADVAEEERPFAVGGDVEVLADVGAVEQQGVDAVLPLDHVAAIARIPPEGVVAGGDQRQIIALVAVDKVVDVAALKRLLAGAGEDRVIAHAAVECQRDRGRRRQRRGVDAVIAAKAADGELVAGIGVVDGHLGRKSGDSNRGAGQRHVDVIAAVAAVDEYSVSLAVARGAADGPREVDRHEVHIGAGEIVDIHDVSAAQGVELDGLDAVQIHGDVGDVAEEAHPVAVGGNVDGLGDVGAVEQHGVGAALALDHVAAVARIPAEGVVAAAEDRQVVALIAVDEIVAAAAAQRILAGAAEDRVVAAAALEQRLDLGAQRREIDGVVAAADRGPDQGGVGDGRRAVRDGNGAAVHQDVARAVAADREGVAGGVAADTQQAGGGIE